jgi:hypothetical protein
MLHFELLGPEAIKEGNVEKRLFDIGAGSPVPIISKNCSSPTAI